MSEEAAALDLVPVGRPEAAGAPHAIGPQGADRGKHRRSRRFRFGGDEDACYARTRVEENVFMRLIVVVAAGLVGSTLFSFVGEGPHANAQPFYDRQFQDEPDYDRQEWSRRQDRARERAERRRERYQRREEQWRNRQLDQRNRQLDRRNRELDQINRELDERNREIARRQRERSRAIDDW